MNNLRKNLICDAHTHFVSEQDLNLRIKQHIPSLICNSTPDEMDFFFSKQLPSFLIPTCGVHPWRADQLSLKDMEAFLHEVPVIGEIGMDSVWCDVPLSVQEKIFEEQLELSSSLKKPVILHTKGQEKQIATLIRKYPNRYLVHWYSCIDHLDEYIEQDCYFSIGPDVWWNPATRNVAKNVPSNRILTETDGLNAVQWAYDEASEDKKTLLHKVPDTTKTSLELVTNTIADLRNITPEECSALTYDNLMSGFLLEM